MKSTFQQIKQKSEYIFEPIPASEGKSIWDRLISKFMQATEYLIFEHSEVTQYFLNQDFIEEDLIPIVVSSKDFNYHAVQIVRFQNTIGVNRIVNYLIEKTEHCLRYFQMSFILDVETLEFDQHKCDEFTNSHLPIIKEVSVKNKVVTKKQDLKYKNIIKWVKSPINYFHSTNRPKLSDKESVTNARLLPFIKQKKGWLKFENHPILYYKKILLKLGNLVANFSHPQTLRGNFKIFILFDVFHGFF